MQHRDHGLLTRMARINHQVSEAILQLITLQESDPSYAKTLHSLSLSINTLTADLVHRAAELERSSTQLKESGPIAPRDRCSAKPALVLEPRDVRPNSTCGPEGTHAATHDPTIGEITDSVRKAVEEKRLPPESGAELTRYLDLLSSLNLPPSGMDDRDDEEHDV